MADNDSVLGQENIVPENLSQPEMDGPVQGVSIRKQALIDARKVLTPRKGAVRETQLPNNISDRQFGKRLGRYSAIEGVNIPEAMAQVQSGGEQLAYLLPRAAVKAAKEIATIPGYVAGFGKWAANGFDSDEYGSAFNNGWNLALERFNQQLNDSGLPVYTPESVQDGNIWNKLGSTSFWSTEGADGVGFLVGMMVPGALLRYMKLGEGLAGTASAIKKFNTIDKLSKPGFELAELAQKSQKTANLINDWSAAAINTVFESAVEGVDAFNGYLEQHPGDVEGAGKAATKTYWANNAILLGPNLLDQKWLFGGFKRSKLVETAIGKSATEKAMSGLLDKTGKIVDEVIKPSVMSKVKGFAGETLLGIGKEGLWEEGMQYIVSDKAQKGEDISNPIDDLKSWVDTITSGEENTEFWSSVVLGGVLGGGMAAFGKAQENKRVEKTVSAYHDLLKGNNVNYLKTLADLAVVKDGKPVMKKNGQYQLDPVKVQEASKQVLGIASIRNDISKAYKAGDIESGDYLMEFLHFNYMLPWLQVEGGKDLLIKHIESLSKQDQEQLQLELGTKAPTAEQTRQNLLDKVERYSKIYEQVNDTHDINFDVKAKPEFKDQLKEFNDLIKNGKLSTKVQIDYAQRRIDALRKDLSTKYKKSIFSSNEKIDDKLAEDLTSSYKEADKEIKFNKQEKIEIEKAIKDINSYNKIYNNAANLLTGYYDNKKLQEAFDERVKKKQDLTKQETIEQESKDIKDPQLRKFYEQNIYIDDLSTAARQIRARVGGDETIERTIPAYNIKMQHRGRVRVHYIDATGKKKSFVAIIGNKAKGNLSLRIIKRTKSGKEEFIKDENGKDIPLVYLHSMTKVSMPTYQDKAYREFDITNIEQVLTPQEALAEFETKIAIDKLKDDIDAYNRLIAHQSDEIDNNIKESARLTELISAYMSEFHKETVTQKAIKELYKEGKIDEEIITKKEALAIVKTYKTLSKIQEQRDKLQKNADTVESARIRYKDRQKEYKDKLKSVKKGELHYTIHTLTDALNDYENAEQHAIELRRIALDAVEKADKTIKVSTRLLKGYRTTIYRILGDSFKDFDLSDTKLDLDFIPESVEKNEMRVQAIVHLLRLHDKEITPDDARTVLTTRNLIDKMEDRIQNAKDVLEKNDAIIKEQRKIISEMAKAKRLVSGERSRLLTKYKNSMIKYFKFDDYSITKGKVSKTDEDIENDFEDTFEKEEAYRVEFEDQALHPFEDWTSFLHTTANQDYANNPTMEHIARWYVYVNNYAYKERASGELKPKHTFITATFDQIGKAKNPELKNQIKFFAKGNLYTYNELKKMNNQELIDEAKNDIKTILVHFEKPSIEYPARFTKEGEPFSKSMKGKGFIMYNSLPLPTLKRETVEAKKSGGDRFSYKKLKQAFINEKKRLGEEYTNDDIDKYVKERTDVAIEKYSEFRTNALKEHQVLDIKYVNPGVKVRPTIENDIDLQDAVTDSLHALNFVVSKPVTKDVVDKENPEEKTRVTIDVSVGGRNYKTRSGFAYVWIKNNLEVIKPKTLGETGDVDNIINLLRYVFAKKEGHEQVKAYLNKILYMTSEEGKKWRFDITGDIKGGIYTNLIYGENLISDDDVINMEGIDELRGFLSKKYWNMHPDLRTDSNKEFIEYKVDNNLKLTRVIWDPKLKEDEQVTIEPNTTRRKGSYTHFMFSNVKNKSKGTVMVKPAPKGKNAHWLLVKDPQYVNQSIQLKQRGIEKEPVIVVQGQESPEIPVATQGAAPVKKEEINEDGILFKTELKNLDSGKVGERYFIYYPQSGRYAFTHKELEGKPVAKDGGTIYNHVSKAFTANKTIGLEGGEIVFHQEGINANKLKIVKIKDIPAPKPKVEEKKEEITSAKVETEEQVTVTDADIDKGIENAKQYGVYDLLKKRAEDELKKEGTTATYNDIAAKIREYIRQELESPNDEGIDRIARNVENYQLENLDDAKKWFKYHFPEFDVETVEGLIAGKSWGRLVKGMKVLLSDVAEEGTIYHESFHVWNNAYNSGKHRKSLYDETRKRLGQDLSDDQCEEFLAEEFRDFIMMGSSYKFNKGEEVKKNLFQWIIDQIKKFLVKVGILDKNDTIEQSFEKIKNGVFTTPVSKITRNFDRLAGLKPEMSLNIIQEVNTAFLDIIMGDLSEGGNLVFNWEEDVNSVYDLVKLRYVNELNKSKSGPVRLAIVKQILDRFTDIKIEHSTFLTQYKIDVRDEIEEDDRVTRNTNDSKAFYNKPITDYAPSAIRLLIAAIPLQDKTGKNVIHPMYKTRSKVDYVKTMNIINSRMSGITTIQGMLTELQRLSVTDPSFSLLYKYLGGDKDANLRTETEFKLAAQFFHTFSSNKAKPYVLIVNNTGGMIQTNLVRETDRGAIISQWKENARSLTDTKKSNYFVFKNNDYYLNKDVILHDLAAIGPNAPMVLTKLGIDLGTNRTLGVGVINEFLSGLKQIIAVNKDKDLRLGDIYDRDVFTMQDKLDDVIEYSSEFLINDSDLMYVNANGKLEWAIQKNSHISEITNRLNELADTYRFEDNPVFPENLKYLQPFDGKDGSLFSLHSRWLNAIMSNDQLKSSEKTRKIEFHLIKGVKDQTGNAFDLDEATFPDYKMASFDAILRNIIPLMRAADRGPEYGFRVEPTNYSIDRGIFISTMEGYLRDELITSIAVNLGIRRFGADLSYYGENAKKLRQFSFLHDSEFTEGMYVPLVEDYVDSIIEKETTFEALQKYTNDYIEQNKENINKLLNKYITRLMNNNKLSLEDSMLIIEAGKGLWKTPGINSDIITSKAAFNIKRDSALRITTDQLYRILLVHAYNQFIGTQEQLKLYLGDLAGYKNAPVVHKRTTSSASTRQQMLNDDESLSIAQKMYPKLNGLPYNKYIKKIITKEIHRGTDISELSKVSENYDDMVIADGGMLATLDFARTYAVRNGLWDENKDMTYHYEIQKLVLMLMEKNKDGSYVHQDLRDIWSPTEEMFTEEDGFFYKHTNGEIPSEPMFNGEIIDPDKCGIIPTIKTLGAGYIRGTEDDPLNVSVMDINKQATDFLFPSQLDNNGLKLYLSMIANDIDKIGDRSTEKADAYENDIDFENEVITDKHQVTYQSYDDYGTQLEMPEYYKNRVKESVQRMSVIFNDMYDHGKILPEFEELEPEIRESIEIRNLLYNRDKKKILHELGITINDEGEYNLKTENINKFKDRLKMLFIRRQLPMNTIDGLESWISSKNKIIDLFTDTNRIEQILVALIKNNVIGRSVFGENLVQVSNYLYSKKLKFYRLGESQTERMEVMIPVPDRWKEWVKSIGGVDKLNEMIEQGKLPEEVLTFESNRVPTASINTIEAAKVVKFLPHYVGAKIVLPYEIVAKTSSDFDIDKLTSYFNAMHITSKGPRVKTISKSDNELEKRYIQYVKEGISGDIRKEFMSLYNEEFDQISEERRELIEKSKERFKAHIDEDIDEISNPVDALRSELDSLFETGQSLFKEYEDKDIKNMYYDMRKEHVLNNTDGISQVNSYIILTGQLLDRGNLSSNDRDVADKLMDIYFREISLMTGISVKSDAIKQDIRDAIDSAKSIKDFSIQSINEIASNRTSTLIMNAYKELAAANEMLSIEDFKNLPILQQQPTDVLNNRINGIYAKALLHKDRFENLVKPHEGKNFKKAASEFYIPISDLEKDTASNSNKLFITTEWWFNSDRGREFWQGIQGVQYGASHNVVYAGMQMNPITIESDIVNLTEPINQNKNFKGLLFFDGQQLEPGEKYSAGFINDADGYMTTDNYGQAIVSFVDVAKDSYMLKLNIQAREYPVFSFLNKFGKESGVGFMQIAAFMSSPIIRKYLNARDNSSSIMAAHNEYNEGSNRLIKDRYKAIDNLLAEQVAKLPVAMKDKVPSQYKHTLASAVYDYTYAKSKEEKEKAFNLIKVRANVYGYTNNFLTIEQLSKKNKTPKENIQILDNFLMYQMFASKGTKLNGSLRFNSSATFPKSISGVDGKLGNLIGVLEDPFFNGSDIIRYIDNSTLSGSRDAYLTTSNAFSWAYIMKKYPKLSQAFDSTFLRILANSGQKWNDIESVLNNVRGSFMNFLYSFNNGEFGKSVTPLRDEYIKMFIGENSMANRLSKIKQKFKGDNALFKELRSLINETDQVTGRLRENSYITTFLRKYSVSKEDELVALFDEYYNSEDQEIRDFTRDLAKYAVYQSGVNMSPASFIRLVPSSIFINNMDNLITKIHENIGLESSDMLVYFNSFIEQFYRNNASNTRVVPRFRKHPVTDLNAELLIDPKNRLTRSKYITARYNRFANKNISIDPLARTRYKYDIVLYRLDNIDGKGYHYKPISKLGDGMRFQEYYPTINGESITSILNVNNPQVLKQVRPSEYNIDEGVKPSQPEKEYKPKFKFNWAKKSKNGYEVSTAGDARYSAFHAILPDGRSIEYHYQVNVKGYSSIKEGKGKPPKNKMTMEESWQAYLGLWKEWAKNNELSLNQLRIAANGRVLTDQFASTDINQARALAEILNTTEPLSDSKGFTVYDDSYLQVDLGDNVEPDEDIDNACRDYLKAIGVTVKPMESMKDIAGSKNPAIAIASISKMTLEVMEGKRNLRTLPEESAHFYVSLLDENDGLYKKMYEDIIKYDEYTETLDKYKDIESYTEKKIREEAIGKLIAKRMTEGIDKQRAQINTWWSRLWDHIKNLFVKAQKDPYAKAAYDILLTGMTNMTIDEVLNPKVEVNDDNFYQIEETNDENLLVKDNIAMDNVKEMSKAPITYDGNRLLDNFGHYFPDMNHLTDQEKINMLRNIENGEIDLVCSF